MARAYGTSSVKPDRTRRTRAQLDELRSELLSIAYHSRPTTARFIFYRATTLGLVPKTQQGYRVVQREVANMREQGSMPFEWIADNTRWMRKPDSYSDLHSFLEESAQLYRRDLWNESRHYVEVWCESDSVAGVIGPVAAEWDVPLMVVRGYSSKTFAYTAAKAIEADGRPSYLYYFGDHDPSGVDIERALRESLFRYAPNAEIYFERVAVTVEQIEHMDLPSSIKKEDDTRSRSFLGDAVEIEAIDADILRDLCREAIESHVNQPQLAALRTIEEAERETLRTMLGSLQ